MLIMYSVGVDMGGIWHADLTAYTILVHHILTTL